MSQTTTKRTLKFYSKEENAFITAYAKSKEPVREEFLQKFCVDNNRPMKSVMFKIYNLRKKMKQYKATSPKGNVVKDNSVAKISKGEFKIPVNNWNITNEDGQMFLNIKF
jgi:hypothetical protein